MTRTAFRKPAVLFICLIFTGGCGRSGNADVVKIQAEADAAAKTMKEELAKAKDELAKAKADADAARAELAKLKDAQAKVAQVAPPSADRKAAEWVLRVDGSVKVVADGVGVLVKKDEKLPDGSLKVVEITLTGTKASDDGTPLLHGLKDIRALSVYRETLITKLDFVEQFLTLEKLEGGGISDTDLSHIKGLSKLKYLDVGYFFGNERITNAGLENVKDLKQLEVLGFLGCANISDAGLLHLKGLKSLKLLVLSRTKVSDAGLEYLKGLTNLEDLRLGETKVTDTGIKILKASLPKCNISKRV